MDQDRRDAAAWAKEWQIKQKNRRLLFVLVGILAAALIIWVISFITIHAERSTFGSVEEMRLAMQGRYAIERDYEDIIIDGDEITLTYMSLSHYDRDYAEKYGYDYYGDDSVYEPAYSLGIPKGHGRLPAPFPGTKGEVRKVPFGVPIPLEHDPGPELYLQVRRHSAISEGVSGRGDRLPVLGR